ncbi:MAG: nickel ABC transporter permease [Gemmatimonadales bacterium]
MAQASLSTYLFRRIISLVPVWIGISILAFVAANLTPGDPAQMILQRESGVPPSAEAVRQLRGELGLDAPPVVRYGRWVGRAVTGDLGLSYRTGLPVTTTLLEPLPNTLRLTLAALFLGVIVALPVGVLAAVRRNTAMDQLSRVLALIGTSVPSFLLGYLLILFFAVMLGVLPATGSDGWRYLVLPALTLALSEAGALTRLTRAGMLEVLREDYVVTARAKGVGRRSVLMRHALRNAINPIVSLAGVRLGRLLGGAFIVETIFARPGIGKTVVDSIQDRDYPTIQGFIVVMGTLFVVINLVVDLIHLWLDPRIREHLAAPAALPIKS